MPSGSCRKARPFWPTLPLEMRSSSGRALSARKKVRTWVPGSTRAADLRVREPVAIGSGATTVLTRRNRGPASVDGAVGRGRLDELEPLYPCRVRGAALVERGGGSSLALHCPHCNVRNV